MNLDRPGIIDFTSANHTHASATQGGTLSSYIDISGVPTAGRLMRWQDTNTAEDSGIASTDVGLKSGNLSQFAATTSAQLAGVISDETGYSIGALLVFNTTPTFTTSIYTPLVIGSTSTTGDLSLQTTSGVGTTGADMHFLVGNNGATEAMTILNSGNIGIGISPSYKLDVNGQFNSTSLSIASGTAYTSISSNAGVAAAILATDSLGRIYIQRFFAGPDAGGVGSGANDIRSAGTGALTVFSTDAYSTPPATRITFGTKYTSGGLYTGGSFIEAGKENATDGNYSYYLAFGTRLNGGSSTESVRIDSSGNVGIGISTFLADAYGTHKLNVATTSNTGLQFSRFSADVGGAIMSFVKSRNATVGSHTIAVAGDRVGTIGFSASDGTAFDDVAQIYAEVDAVTGTVMSGRLGFKTTTTGGTSTVRMLIDDDGNVGIGTITPNGKLNVVSTATDQLTLSDSNAYSDGTARTVSIDFKANNPSSIITFQSANISAIITPNAGRTVPQSALTFSTKDNILGYGERVRIDAVGNVGIGVTAPLAKLHSVSTTEQLRLGYDAATNQVLFTVSSSGDLTIAPSGDDVLITGNLTLSAKNIITDTVTGMKIGTATTQKIGFFNSTPIVKPSAYTQTYNTASKTVPALTIATLTDSTGGTADTTLAAVEAAYTQATIRNNFADLASMVNKNTVDLTALFKVVTQLIDDLQSLGLVA